MDLDTDIVVNTEVLRVFKSGRVERLIGNDVFVAGFDPETSVTCKDVVIDSATNITARIFISNIDKLQIQPRKLPIVVYYHGGGFCAFSHSCSSFTRFLRSIVAKANVIAISIGYRLAPEHPLPTAYDDSFVALKWVISNPSKEEWLNKYGDFNKIFLVGDSAGANIAHHMALRATGMGIKGLTLIHPWFLSQTSTTMELKMIELLWKMVCPKTTGLDDPLINPFVDGAPSLKGLAGERMLVMVAEYDIMKDIQKEYYKRVKESGWVGRLELFETEGEGHGFYGYNNPATSKTLDLVQRLATFFNG